MLIGTPVIGKERMRGYARHLAFSSEKLRMISTGAEIVANMLLEASIDLALIATKCYLLPV